MSANAGEAVKALYTPDEKGRIYCGQGVKTDEFEQLFKDATGLRDENAPLGVNSCTAAIDLSLHLIGVGPGDEVVSVGVTCAATHTSLVNRGAKIVWADIDPITGLIDPNSVARVVSSKTKAVIAVDWAGRWCDYVALKQSVLNSIPIIEDAAHCLYIPEVHGDYVCYSLGPIKHLTTGGYGGMLLPPPHHYKRAELLRWHGLDRHSNADFRAGQNIVEAGYRYHMTDDQAVVGMANLSVAKVNVASARFNATRYARHFKSLPGITMPPFDRTSNYWLHGIIIEGDRDEFQRRMAERGIPTSRAHARNDVHDAFVKATARQDGDLPGTTYFDSHQTNIPGGAWLKATEINEVLEAVPACLTTAALT